jgi:GT2 family glycosyltransferase
MLVSILCVCHNKPDLAHEAIQSILDQSYPTWQALIVDSGLLYDSGYYEGFPWRHDPRIQLIRSTETPALRRTKAMAPWCFNECFRRGLVSGDLVMYLCDDDILYPNAFETFVSYTSKNPHVKAMYASQDIGMIWPNGKRAIVGERRATTPAGRSCSGRVLDCEVDYLQLCHKREILRYFPDDEYWPEDKETETHADGIFMERIGAIVPIYPIDVKVSQNRRTPQSLNDPVDWLPNSEKPDHLAERCRLLRNEVVRWRVEAENWRQQYLFNHSYRQSLAQSFFWRLLRPLRIVRQLVRPRGFDMNGLIPWRQLERDEQAGDNAWLSTDAQACFLVPCELPAGWLRIQVRLTSNIAGRFEIMACGGNGISDAEAVFQAESNGILNEDCHIYLAKPALGLQINPLGTAGRFELEKLSVVPLSWLGGLGHGFSRRAKTPSVGWVESARPIAWPFARVQGWSAKTTQHRCSDRASDSQTECEYPNLCLSREASVDWSIIIPTINDAQRVVKCISTCRQHLEPTLNVEFLVVDDGTLDMDKLEKLQRKSAELEFRVLRNHQNLGFSATINHGLRHARGRYLALCNNDIVFRQSCFGAMTRAFETHPEVGIVGCKLLYPSGAVQHAGMDKVPGQARWTHTYHGSPADDPLTCRSRYVWSVTGALCALRRDTVRRLGGLSTAYALAYEDLDYCLRAWTRGVRVYYCAEAVAVHEESGTLGRTRRARKKRPLMWTERERAGRRYFDKKWRALRDVESVDELITAASPDARCGRHAAPAQCRPTDSAPVG